MTPVFYDVVFRGKILPGFDIEGVKSKLGGLNSAKICLYSVNFDEIEKYLNFGGMRYEGDYVIEDGKSRRLGLKMPKTIEEVEAERAKAYAK